MGQMPSQAQRATDVLGHQRPCNDEYVALGDKDEWIPAEGRIARFAAGKQGLFNSHDKLQPKSLLVHHAFVMLDVVWEAGTSSGTQSQGVVVAEAVDPPSTAGDEAKASDKAGSSPAPAVAPSKVRHREFWRLEFTYKSRVFLSKFAELPEGYAKGLVKWEIPPRTRYLRDVPARQAGFFDVRTNNSQHYQHRVLRFLRGTRRLPPPEWFKFWKWGSDCGGDLPAEGATAEAVASGAGAGAGAGAADTSDGSGPASAKRPAASTSRTPLLNLCEDVVVPPAAVAPNSVAPAVIASADYSDDRRARPATRAEQPGLYSGFGFVDPPSGADASSATVMATLLPDAPSAAVAQVPPSAPPAVSAPPAASAPAPPSGRCLVHMEYATSSPVHSLYTPSSQAVAIA